MTVTVLAFMRSPSTASDIGAACGAGWVERARACIGCWIGVTGRWLRTGPPDTPCVVNWPVPRVESCADAAAMLQETLCPGPDDIVLPITWQRPAEASGPAPATLGGLKICVHCGPHSSPSHRCRRGERC